MLADVIFILKYFTNSILFLYNDIEFLLTISSFSWSPVLGIQFFLSWFEIVWSVFKERGRSRCSEGF